MSTAIREGIKFNYALHSLQSSRYSIQSSVRVHHQWKRRLMSRFTRRHAKVKESRDFLLPSTHTHCTSSRLAKKKKKKKKKKKNRGQPLLTRSHVFSSGTWRVWSFDTLANVFFLSPSPKELLILSATML